MSGVFIVGAKRTAFGAFGGSLKNFTATQLATHAGKAAIAEAKVNPEIIDSVIFGNVIQTASDSAYLSRHVGLHCGAPIEHSALTINRLCGSGFQSIINACQEIAVGDASVVLTGGTENMSQAPYAVRDARWGTKLGTDLKMEDTLWQGLTDQYAKIPMAITAENLAEQKGLSRVDCDEQALRSQHRWGEANAAGVFDAEIAPMEVKTRKGVVEFKVDEHARPTTGMENLAKLPSVFKKGGVVTAGNASGICDGAAAVLVASEAAANQHGMTPLARVVSWQVSGVDPSIMGIGPVPAIRGALKRADLSLDDMAFVEVNEAFAAQMLSVAQDLGLDMAKTNAHGGAIALGHPLGASGSRIMAHLTHQLLRTNERYAVGSACIGGGQGIAIVIENMQKK